MFYKLPFNVKKYTSKFDNYLCLSVIDFYEHSCKYNMLIPSMIVK
ncbi:Uncharacterised protein [Legionella pneumophila]|nr:Uncharacterised protein [Legionella pneumophila]